MLTPPHPSTAKDGLPSMAMPSDHIPLLARFELSAAAAAVAPADEGQTGREWARQAVQQNGGMPTGAGVAADGSSSAAGRLQAGNGAGTLAGSGGGSRLDAEEAGGQRHAPPKFVGIGTVL